MTHTRLMPFIKCLQCEEILESKSLHDYVSRSCPNHTFLDGGDEHCRYGGKDMDKVQMTDSTTICSFTEENYPTYDGFVDDRPIHEVLDEIHRKLKNILEYKFSFNNKQLILNCSQNWFKPLWIHHN